MHRVTSNQAQFYREFLMGRGSFSPMDFGVNMEKPEFIDAIVDIFGSYSHGQMTVDEMLLRPRMAMHFCDNVRQARGWFDVPDDIVLRSLLQRRKNPN